MATTIQTISAIPTPIGTILLTLTSESHNVSVKKKIKGGGLSIENKQVISEVIFRERLKFNAYKLKSLIRVKCCITKNGVTLVYETILLVRNDIS